MTRRIPAFAPGPHPSTSTDAPAGGVLVLADDYVLARLLEAALASGGIDATCAGSGRDALERLDRAPARLLLLDANISSPSCGEFLRALRRRVTPKPAVLGLVMPGQASLRALTRRLGVDDFVVEPFRPAELTARARALLSPTPV